MVWRAEIITERWRWAKLCVYSWVVTAKNDWCNFIKFHNGNLDRSVKREEMASTFLRRNFIWRDAKTTDTNFKIMWTTLNKIKRNKWDYLRTLSAPNSLKPWFRDLRKLWICMRLRVASNDKNCDVYELVVCNIQGLWIWMHLWDQACSGYTLTFELLWAKSYAWMQHISSVTRWNNREIALPPNFSKTCLVVRCNNKSSYNHFGSRKMVKQQVIIILPPPKISPTCGPAIDCTYVV